MEIINKDLIQLKNCNGCGKIIGRNSINCRICANKSRRKFFNNLYKICIDCGKSVTNYTAKRCQKCYFLNPKNKIKQSIAKKGERNPAKRVEVRKKISETLKRKYKSGEIISFFKKGHKINNGRIHSKKYKENRQGGKNPFYGMHHSKQTIDKIRKTLIKNLRLGKYNLKPTKPEQMIITLIKENNFSFDYVGNGKIWFKGENHSFNPDFLSKNPKYIIEIFGDYWHNLSNNIIKDKERVETYLKYGYKTLIIWEHELKDSFEVLNKIQRFLK